ncbi:hypothetical protein ACJJTC_010947 [Scirpophaga incertulas]
MDERVTWLPLITDEIDISPWKNILMKFSQVHVCLEHLYRAETWLRADFASLKPVTSYLLQHYVSEKSPIKTIGQLMSDPVQKVVMHDCEQHSARSFKVSAIRKPSALVPSRTEQERRSNGWRRPRFASGPRYFPASSVSTIGLAELRTLCRRCSRSDNDGRRPLNIIARSTLTLAMNM